MANFKLSENLHDNSFQKVVKCQCDIAVMRIGTGT